MQRTPSADLLVRRAKKRGNVDEAVRYRIRDCPYAFMFNQIDWKFDRGVLILEGAVQSFYLKQVLQELMRDLEDVEQVVNHVDVVNPTGLSSVRPRQPNGNGQYVGRNDKKSDGR